VFQKTKTLVGEGEGLLVEETNYVQRHLGDLKLMQPSKFADFFKKTVQY